MQYSHHILTVDEVEARLVVDEFDVLPLDPLALRMSSENCVSAAIYIT